MNNRLRNMNVRPRNMNVKIRTRNNMNDRKRGHSGARNKGRTVTPIGPNRDGNRGMIVQNRGCSRIGNRDRRDVRYKGHRGA